MNATVTELNGANVTFLVDGRERLTGVCVDGLRPAVGAKGTLVSVSNGYDFHFVSGGTVLLRCPRATGVWRYEGPNLSGTHHTYVYGLVELRRRGKCRNPSRVPANLAPGTIEEIAGGFRFCAQASGDFDYDE